MSIGQRLFSLRQQYNLSQKDLCKLVNITEATLSRYENNLRKPSGEVVAKLARTLNVTTEYLIFGDDITPLATSSNKDIQLILNNLKKSLLEDKDSLTLDGKSIHSLTLDILIVSIDTGVKNALRINEEFSKSIK